MALSPHVSERGVVCSHEVGVVDAKVGPKVASRMKKPAVIYPVAQHQQDPASASPGDGVDAKGCEKGGSQNVGVLDRTGQIPNRRARWYDDEK